MFPVSGLNPNNQGVIRGREEEDNEGFSTPKRQVTDAAREAFSVQERTPRMSWAWVRRANSLPVVSVVSSPVKEGEAELGSTFTQSPVQREDFQTHLNSSQLDDNDFVRKISEFLMGIEEKLVIANQNKMPLPEAAYFLVMSIQFFNTCPNEFSGSPEIERLKNVAIQIVQSQGFNPDEPITEEFCNNVGLGRQYTGATLYWLAAHFNYEELVRAMHVCKPNADINAKVLEEAQSDSETEFYGNVFAQVILNENWELALEMLCEDRKVDLGMWIETGDTITCLLEFIIDEYSKWNNPLAIKLKHRMLDYCKISSIGKLESGFKIVGLFNLPGPGPLAKHFILREMSLCHEPDQRTLTLKKMRATKKSVLADVFRTWKYATEHTPTDDGDKYLNAELIRTIRNSVDLLENLLRDTAIRNVMFRGNESREINNVYGLKSLRERDSDLKDIPDYLLIQVLCLFENAEFERSQREVSGEIATRVIEKWRQKYKSFNQHALFGWFAPGNVEFVTTLIADMIAKKYISIRLSLSRNLVKQNEIVDLFAALPFEKVTRELLEQTLNNLHVPAQNILGLGPAVQL